MQFVKNRAIFHTVFLGTSLARIFHCSFLNPEGTFSVLIFYLIFSLSLLLILYGAKTCTSNPKSRAAKKETNQKRRRREEWQRELEMKEKIGEKGARSLRNGKMLKHLIHSALGQMLRQKMSERKRKLDHFFTRVKGPSINPSPLQNMLGSHLAMFKNPCFFNTKHCITLPHVTTFAVIQQLYDRSETL